MRVRALPAAQPLLERLGDRSDVFLVGGAVRDLLLGGAPPDLDLLAEGDPVALASDAGRRSSPARPFWDLDGGDRRLRV